MDLNNLWNGMPPELVPLMEKHRTMLRKLVVEAYQTGLTDVLETLAETCEEHPGLILTAFQLQETCKQLLTGAKTEIAEFLRTVEG